MSLSAPKESTRLNSLSFPPAPGPDAPELAALLTVLAAGGVVGYPSGTVWGLAARPDQPDAAQRLAQAKGRDPGKPIQLSCQDAGTARRWVRPGQPGFEALARRWPQPLTLLAWAAEGVPGWLAPGGVVGLRVPAEPAALALLRGSGGTLLTTSLNRAGEPPARTHAEAQALALADRLWPAEGMAQAGLPSTVVDVRTGQVIREGTIGAEQIGAWLAGDRL